MRTHNGRKWTTNQLIDAVKISRSLSEVMKILGLHPRGGNYETIKRHISFNKIDISHMDGKPFTTGKRLINTSSLRNSKHIKARLIDDRGHRCQCCGRNQWMEVEIKIELHHIDGDRSNNEDSNLQLLCPNCHSITPNWRRRK